MKRILVATLFAGLSATTALADCFADYTASRSNPYDLHYGVAEISGSCNVRAAEEELRPRLARAGWELLEVRDTFGRAGAERRSENAGNNYLRY